MAYKEKLKIAQEDSKRLDASERVCSLIGMIPGCGHGGEVWKAYNKGSGHIEWFCESCIVFFDSICDPHCGKNADKGLKPEYVACFEIKEETETKLKFS